MVTALPVPRIFTGNAAKAAEVAAKLGIPQEEAARAVAAFWGQEPADTARASPIEQRVVVLRRYWHVFDEIHIRQKSGMPPLWGLVEAVHALLGPYRRK